MDLVLLLKAAVLGVVEGITEFLPISSTGHLIVAGRAIGFDDPTFEIFIQFGAILSIIALYRHDLWKRCCGLTRPGADRRVAINIIVAFLPAAIMGALFHHAIKEYLFRPITVALALIVGGVAILVVERVLQSGKTRSLDEVTSRQSLGIGCAQVIAMWPGFSRAAASILGGMLSGLDRTTATVFSFYLAIPTMLGATVMDLYGARHDLRMEDAAPYAVGFIVSFIVAWAAIKGLLHFISRHSFNAFGIYRIVIGLILLAFIFARSI